ncbi:lipocalin-like domain-containing protein [Chitinophaga vietnamensis]|uniref:lipocalin family protein n=1 Tax=Chitinophaga vietnamensis TaxID=2593957 RepID=UPI001177EA4B|nr:lipocalin family protein [Chitinophaga vietnamensis]
MLKEKGLWLLIMVFVACNPAPEHEPVKTNDDSLVGIADSSDVVTVDSTTAAVADTLHVDAAKLIGKWIQPVTGVDKEMQGFQLRKNGTAKSINMYTLVYEKWLLSHDTLFLWNHSEGVKDTTTLVDTTVIKELTDTSLVLAPLKAAAGYKERYQRSHQ